MPAISRSSISTTYDLIWPFIRTTPVIDVTVPGSEAKPVFKLEACQHSGSFKARGAFANLLGLDSGVAVATASGGNHGAAVAYAARELGHPARIFVPEIASPAKIARIRDYGAEVVVGGANYAQAFAAFERYCEESGAHPVHAYDGSATVNGQGTLGLELEQQAPGIDTVLVAVGGGGLIGGVAAWFGGGPAVVGVEPEGCPTLHAALAAGAPGDITPCGVAADSLGASRIGTLAFEIAVEDVERVVLVSDEDIRAAQRWLWNETRLIVEPGGATALAALLSGKYQAYRNERVCVVLCGGNCDPGSVVEPDMEAP